MADIASPIDMLDAPRRTAPAERLAAPSTRVAGTAGEAPAPVVDRRGPLRPEVLSPTRARLNGAVLARGFQAVDAALISLVALAVLSQGRAGVLFGRSLAEATPLMVEAMAALWALRGFRAYALPSSEGLALHLARVSGAVALAALAGLVAAHLLAPALASAVGLGAALLLLALGSSHLWSWASVRRWRRGGRLTPNVVVVGATPNAQRLIEAALARRDLAVLGIFDDRADRAPPAIRGVPVLGDTRRLLEHRVIPYVDRVVITVTTASQPRVRELVERLRVLPNPVTLFLDVEGHDTRAATLSRLAEAPLVGATGAEADARRAVAKRVQDLVFGALALVLAAPAMAAVALAVRLDSPGPVLFRQRRHGFNNEVITVWKFRSMRHEAADASAARQVSADDDRITRVGRFIRRTSLDELPQLLNVLRGEMSLVGPRPHAIGMKTAGEESARLVAEYAWRHRMKPGITGWAQIKGSRGPVDTPEAVRERVALDIDYIERQSFGLDLAILLATLPCLIGDRAAVR